MGPKRSVRVAAAVIVNAGSCLLQRRPEGSHMAGYWEFPGGKIEEGESVEAALRREAVEELGVRLIVGSPLWIVAHDYPDRTVELNFVDARIESGEPQPLWADRLGWFLPTEMPSLPLLPADLEILPALEAHLERHRG